LTAGRQSSDPPAEHRSSAPSHLGYGILTISSSRSLEEDESGQRAAELAEASGGGPVERRLVTDDTTAIRRAVQELLADPAIDVLVVTGGTGFSPCDRTPEAVAPLLERRIEGFGELFRQLSFGQVGAAAMLSRALAGVVAGKAVFVVPGSPKAVELAMERLILPEAGHLVGQVRREARAPEGL
jgi:molybdopterin adenylyltransferase